MLDQLRFVGLVLMFTVFIFGCGSDAPVSAEDKAKSEQANNLNDVYELLQIYEQDSKKPAKSINDLTKYENAFPGGYQAIKSGDVKVNWNKRIEDGVLLAAYTSSKLAIFGDRSVKTVKDDDLKPLN